MSVDEASFDFKPARWARFIQAPKSDIWPDAARYLMAIDFGEAFHARMQELMDGSNEGTLTAQESAELDGYVNIANVLLIMHSQARVALNRPSFELIRDAIDS